MSVERNIQISIVFVVKLCKQCLQTASAAGGLGPDTRQQVFAPEPHCGDFCSPDSLGCSPPNENLWCHHWI